MILSDNETKVDLLNNEAVALTIIELLKEKPQHPVTVGVHGDWGAGKSSILEMIEANLSDQNDVLCIKFNGWRFQGFEDAKIALIEGIVSELIEKRPGITKAADTAKDLFKRINWLKVAKAGGSLALAAHGVPLPGQIDSVINSLKKVGESPETVDAAIEEAKSFLNPSESSIPEEINGFREAFDSLLESAGVSQLIVLVDDLDRCLPDVAIETLEAIRLFVFTSNTAFVIAADESMIEYAVRKHFPDLPDTTRHQIYARNYLEKLIQVPFRLPPLGEMETRIYVTLLLVGSELGEDDSGFNDLISEARTRLKKPWENSPIDGATLREKLKDKSGDVQNALILADQIGPSLAAGTKGNPRQIKRFLNALILRQRTAEARGFGGSVKLPILAKLMIAESFMPRLFDQIATSSASSNDGVCGEIASLNQALASEEDKPKEKKEKSNSKAIKEVKAPESGLVSEWLSSKEILAWMTIEPSLDSEDLRPYLFVSKDRKDYFGSTTALGHLSSIAEKLFGNKLAVQTLTSDLQLLSAPEAAQLFEAVRGRIISTADFSVQPAGIDGLVVLVQSHPELQDSLVDFLEGLPVDSLGVWVVKGWNAAVTNQDAQKRLSSLMDKWGQSESNPILKVAATSVKKVSGKGFR